MSVFPTFLLRRRTSAKCNSLAGVLAWALVVFLLAVSSTSAQNINWTGTTSTDWNTGTNWDSGSAPVSGNIVIFDGNSGNQAVLSSGNATTGNIVIGNTSASGANTSLTISNGSLLQASLIFLGNSTGSTGSLLVTDPGTILNTSNIPSVPNPGPVGINIGNNGTGAVTIANGAHVTGSCLVNNGSLLVTGDGSFLSTISTQHLILGHNTTTTVADGANLTTKDLLLTGQGSSLLVTGKSASGNSSVVNLIFDLFVSVNATANLTIANGGHLISNFGAQLQDANATILITDPGSLLNGGNGLSGDPNLGFEDGFYVENGTNVVVANGGNLTTKATTLGFFSNSTGYVTIEDSNSVWNATGNMFVGYNSGGNVTLANGGALVVTGGSLVLGKNANSAGILNLGGNSTVSVTGGNIVLGQNATAAGIVNLNAGSELSLGSNFTLQPGAGNATLNFAGGTLQIDSNLTWSGNTAITPNTDGAFIDTDGNNLTFSGTLSGNGDLTKLGAGTLQVSRPASIGNLNIAAGTLSLLANGSQNGITLGPVSGNGTLNVASLLVNPTLNESIDSTFAGNITGSGQIAKLGLGTLTLTGNIASSIAFNITVGSIVLAPSAAAATGTYRVNGGNLIFACDSDVGFSGTLGAYTGNFTKTGLGKLTLLQVEQLFSTTYINAGTLAPTANFLSNGSNLVLQGGNLDLSSYPNTLELMTDMQLSGNGSVKGTLTVGNNGTLTAGINGTGTLNISGNLLTSVASTCNFGVNDSGNFSTLDVTNTLSENGNVVIHLGSTLQVGTYELITAKKRKGNFKNVSLTGLYTGTLKTSGANSTEKISGATFTFNSSTGKFTIAVPYPAGAAAAQKAWLNDNFTVPQLLNPAVAGNTGTPSNDGVPNLVKYAFNLDPWQNESAALPQPSVVGNNLVLTFTKYHPDVTYTVEASTDLVHWSTKGVKLKVVKNVVTATYALPHAGMAYMHIVVKQ